MNDSEPLLSGPPLASGLQLKSTPRLCQLLRDADKVSTLTEDQRELIEKYRTYSPGSFIPFKLLQSLLEALRSGTRIADEQGPWLHEFALGSGLHLPPPKPREKSKELTERLAKLKEAEERRQYRELVKDVTLQERRLEDREYLSTYKDQLGFGIHVVAIMATGFVAGYVGMKALYPDQMALRALGGVLGLVAGMFVEVFLFIIHSMRAEEQMELAKKDPNRRKGRRAGEDDVSARGVTDAVLLQGPPSQDSSVRRRKFL
eukprot:jgi/Mesen1/1456/ME000132S00396